ncbi:MAG: hypothetical protein HFI17_18600 [Lachnospiraceae bacterium]|nr:hypothetical protein [Lachnospiraceae bacterium]
MKGLFVSPSLTIMPMQAWFVRLAGKNRLLEKEIKIFFQRVVVAARPVGQCLRSCYWSAYKNGTS